jgi:uncharacterized protein YkwD
MSRSHLGSAAAAGLFFFVLCLASPAVHAPAQGHAAEPAAKASSGCPGAKKKARKISPRRSARAVRCLINKRRQARGIRQLRNNEALRQAARKHSRYQVRKNCYSHQCPGEPDLYRRTQREGYPGCRCSWSVAETIAWRRGRKSSPKRVVRAWMKSPSHRRILLDSSKRHVGVGVVWGSPRAGHNDNRIRAGMFTAVFGRRK